MTKTSQAATPAPTQAYRRKTSPTERAPLPVALSKNYELLVNKDPKMNAQFVRRQIIGTDNTITLDRDPGRSRPVITVLHWWPQVGKKKVKK